MVEFHRGINASAALVPTDLNFFAGHAVLHSDRHHVTDVLVGMVNGLVCALLAWGYLRRDGSHAGDTDTDRTSTADRESSPA